MALFRKHRYLDEDDDDIDMTLDFSNDSLLSWGERNTVSKKSPHALTPSEVMGDDAQTVKNIPMSSGDNGPSLAAKQMLDKIYRKEQKPTEVELEEVQEPTKEEFSVGSEEFLRRCKEKMDGKDDFEYTITADDSIDDIIRSAERMAKEKIALLYNQQTNREEVQYEIKAEEPKKDALVEEKLHILEPINKHEEPKEHKLSVEIIDMDSEDSSVKTIKSVDEIKVESEPVEDLGNTVVFEKPQKNNADIFEAISKAAEIKFSLADDEDLSATRVMPKIDSENISSNGKVAEETDKTMKITFPHDEEEETLESTAKSSISEIYDDDEEDFEEDLQNIKDYESPADARDLIGIVKSKLSRLGVRIAVSIIATLLLLATNLSVFSSVAFMTYVAPVILFVALICNFEVFSGMVSIFKGKPDYNTTTSFFGVVILVHQILQILVIKSPNYIDLGAIAGLSLVFNAITGYIRQSRILNGLEHISNADCKYAVTLIDNPRDTKTISGNAIEGESLIVAKQSVTIAKDYMKQSLSRSRFEFSYPLIFIVGLFIAAITGCYVGIFRNNFTDGLFVFELFTALLLPIVSLISSELPLKKISDALYTLGAVISGHYGADRIAESNAVTINATDIFADGSVTMCNMHLLGSSEVEHSIIDAAAVVRGANSPLYGMFRQIMGQIPEKQIPIAEEINYEAKMGVSGWIGEKRILVGNRTLMEGHGVKVPPIAIDQKILKAGFFPVYVACDNKACLLFSVKYNVEKKTAKLMQKLCNAGMTILVESTDPNINERMISDYFDLYDDAVKVINLNGVVCLKKVTAPLRAKTAPAVCSENNIGYLSTVVSSINLSKVQRSLSAVYYVLAILVAFGSVACLLLGRLELITPFYIFVYTSIISGFVTLLGLIKRP